MSNSLRPHTGKTIKTPCHVVSCWLWCWWIFGVIPPCRSFPCISNTILEFYVVTLFILSTFIKYHLLPTGWDNAAAATRLLSPWDFPGKSTRVQWHWDNAGPRLSGEGGLIWCHNVKMPVVVERNRNDSWDPMEKPCCVLRSVTGVWTSWVIHSVEWSILWDQSWASSLRVPLSASGFSPAPRCPLYRLWAGKAVISSYLISRK